MHKFQNPHTLWKTIDRAKEGFAYLSRYQKEREAYLISLFAVGYELLTETDGCEVRLVENKEPIEAELRTKTGIFGFQIAMAVKEGTNIKEECKNAKITPKQLGAFEDFAKRIEVIVAKKMKKYGSGNGVNLLIYGNMSFMTPDAHTMINRFANLASDFDSIWFIMQASAPTRTGITNGHVIIKIAPDPVPHFYGFSHDEMSSDKALKRHGVFI